MKKLFTIFLLLISLQSFAQINFNDYFFDKSLRVDYSHYGNSNSQSIALIEMREEPFWGGSKTNLLDEFLYGNYRFEVIDSSTNKVIFSKGYSTLFAEWLTTAEAKLTTKSFYESIIFPYPKKNAILKFYTRNKDNKFDETFSLQIDPMSPFIKKDRRN
ncbi:MAG: peptidase M64, partial [Ignavibacteria bacterium]|nr:peptidase M64 [Ignavibacteria bacterium]